MPGTRAAIVALAAVLLTVGCSGRRAQYQAFEREMCACSDVACVKATEERHRPTTEPSQTWWEAHFTSRQADDAARDALLAALACAERYRLREARCGGVKQEVCPAGYRCMIEGPRGIVASQGRCERDPDYVLKEGDACILPTGRPCGPGLLCLTEQVGAVTSIGHCVRGKPGLGSLGITK